MDSLAENAESSIVEEGSSAEEIAQALNEKGAVLCRGAIDPKALAVYRDNAERFFDHVEFLGLNKLDLEILKPYNCTTSRMGASVFAMNLRLKPPQFPFLHLLRESYLYPAVGTWLKSEKPMFLFHNSRVRRVYPPYHLMAEHVKSAFPYHQDGSPVGGMLETLTCWMPLGDAGGSAPGIEIALKPMDRLLPLLDDPASPYRDFELAEDLVESEAADAPRWRPQMELGDVMLIPAGTLYRTQVDDSMLHTGNLAELRFAASENAERFPMEKRVITP